MGIGHPRKEYWTCVFASVTVNFSYLIPSRLEKTESANDECPFGGLRRGSRSPGEYRDHPAQGGGEEAVLCAGRHHGDRHLIAEVRPGPDAGARGPGPGGGSSARPAS